MDDNQIEGSARKSNMMKYIIIAVVVVVVLLFLIPRVLGMIGGAAISAATGGQVSSDGKTVNYSNDQGSVSAGANATLPENWPGDVPSYAGAKIGYSGTSNPSTGKPGAAVMMTSSDSVATVAAFYKTQLAALGWKIGATANVGGATMISATKDTRTIGMQIADNGSGGSAITIGVETK